MIIKFYNSVLCYKRKVHKKSYKTMDKTVILKKRKSKKEMFLKINTQRRNQNDIRICQNQQKRTKYRKTDKKH